MASANVMYGKGGKKGRRGHSLSFLHGGRRESKSSETFTAWTYLLEDFKAQTKLKQGLSCQKQATKAKITLLGNEFNSTYTRT